MRDYHVMRENHREELAGWVQAALRGAASPTGAAKRHGVNHGTMSRLARRFQNVRGTPPRTPETYEEIRDRHEREVLEWIREALAEYGSVVQVAENCGVNRGTVSRIARRLRDA